MRQPWEWQPEDVHALLREQRTESLGLEYKCSSALGKTDTKKREITKDVSAMANSAGGTIVYGIDEQNKSDGLIRLDQGVDPHEVSTEWLEQVIDSGIQRRIPGLRVHHVTMLDTESHVYIVWVPQSILAPHMAADHRYYKRLGTVTAMMEEYEVRDVGRRSEAPDLDLELKASIGPPGEVLLMPRIVNRSAEPVFYATCRLYIDMELTVLFRPHLSWSGTEDAEMFWNNRERLRFHVARHQWSVPAKPPILEGEHYPLGSLSLHTGFDNRNSTDIRRYNIGWELRAPRTAAKLQGRKLTIDREGPRIEFECPLMPV